MAFRAWSRELVRKTKRLAAYLNALRPLRSHILQRYLHRGSRYLLVLGQMSPDPSQRRRQYFTSMQVCSIGRRLPKTFAGRWLESEPNAVVITRDIGRNPPPLVTEAWGAAAFTLAQVRRPDQNEELRLSDELIDELDRATSS